MCDLEKRDFLTQGIDKVFEYNENKLKDLGKILKNR